MTRPLKGTETEKLNNLLVYSPFTEMSRGFLLVLLCSSLVFLVKALGC